jgi:AbrB family looped-hinge helix DNA binding protein
MADKGYRKVQEKGEITLPKEFREDNNLEKGDKVDWKRHSRDNSKLIIDCSDSSEGSQD